MGANEFYDLFTNPVPIIGMIHLAGRNTKERVNRALEEIAIYEEEGIDGVIVENFFGGFEDIKQTLIKLSEKKHEIVFGINVLPNQFHSALPLAGEYKAKFIQLDYVAGRYKFDKELQLKIYTQFRNFFPNIAVLGGVWPKHYQPVPESNLEQDIKEGMERADVIVVTGEATGKETPIEKINEFRKIIGDYPLIIGAGLNPKNAYGQLIVADGAIVGTYFKKNAELSNPVDKVRVSEFMGVVIDVRNYKKKQNGMANT